MQIHIVLTDNEVLLIQQALSEYDWQPNCPLEKRAKGQAIFDELGVKLAAVLKQARDRN